MRVSRLILVTMATVVPALALGACHCPSGRADYGYDRRGAALYRGDASVRTNLDEAEVERDWSMPEDTNVGLDVEGDVDVNRPDDADLSARRATPETEVPDETKPDTGDSQDTTRPMTLDGASFDLNVTGEGDSDVPDQLVFRNGLLETQIAEGQPTTGVTYQSWPIEGGIGFSATGVDAKGGRLEWRGTVRGDQIEGTVTRTPSQGGTPELSSFTGQRIR